MKTESPSPFTTPRFSPNISLGFAFTANSPINTTKIPVMEAMFSKFFFTANTIAQINKRDDYLTSSEIVLPPENHDDLNMRAAAVLSGMLLACALMVAAIFFATTRFCSAVRRQVDVVDGEFGIELNVLQPPQAQQQLESSQQSPQQSSQESHQPPSPRPSPVLDPVPRWRGIFRWPMFNRARPNTTV